MCFGCHYTSQTLFLIVPEISESSVSLEDESSIAESTDPYEMSDELKVFGLVEPYDGEPWALSGDDSDDSDKDSKADQDSLFPTTLRLRFQQEVLVNEQ